MLDLARSFGDVAEAYDLGRPRYDAHVIATIGALVGGPRLLDVGAGTGRLAAPLSEAGYDVVGVEPLDGMRAILVRAIGPERALAGSAEALPLPDASVDGAMCSDAWHWFDGPRAADELARVVRPGGGVVVCISLPSEDDPDRPGWTGELDAVIGELLRAVDHPHRDGTRKPEALDGHPAFDPVQVRTEPFVHHTDRERILAHVASMSFVASLDSPRQGQVLARIDEILARHGVEDVAAPYVAELWITRRRLAAAPR